MGRSFGGSGGELEDGKGGLVLEIGMAPLEDGWKRGRGGWIAERLRSGGI